MELNQIEKLLKSYELGETSLHEEAQIKAYFSNNETPAHLDHYRTLFNYFKNIEQQTYDTALPTRKFKLDFKVLSIAASIVLLFGLFLKGSDFINPKVQPLSEKEILIYNQTKSALEFLSLNLNKGTKSQMNAINTLSNTIQIGQNNFTLLRNFNTTANKIFKLNP